MEIPLPSIESFAAHHSSREDEIVILPLGATEQHGPHLPIETDWIIAEAVAAMAKARAPDLPLRVLPVEKVGYSVEHSDDPRTRTLSFDAAIQRWINIGQTQVELGAGKIVFLNAHGGNSPLMTIVTTELRMRHQMLAVATSWTRFGYPADIVDDTERRFGIHAGLVETSVMLALRPDLVQMERAANFASEQAQFEQEFKHLRAYGPHAFGWMMRDLSVAGAAGNAAAARAEMGQAILDHAVDGFVELLRDVARFDRARFHTDEDEGDWNE